jgi:hypothetical protein
MGLAAPQLGRRAGPAGAPRRPWANRHDRIASSLRSFLYSDWCANLSHPFIDYGILGAHNNETLAEQKALAASLGAYTSTRYETFAIP